jgi:hypothetical protein
MSSSAVPAPVVKAKTLSCPGCGGPVELRGFGHTLSVVCPQCHAVLDVSTPPVQILQRAQEAQERIQPTIPLGTRGQIENITWEVIGFQVRRIEVEFVPYSWDEYLLFNPYYGFRYLSEYDGHWNFIRTLPMVPRTIAGARPERRVLGVTYKHFQHSSATTTFVLGEFPWRARQGDTATVDDFIAPPRLLSAERMDGEVVWSLGEYWTSEQIWKAFALPGPPDRALGVYENQPSPHQGQAGAMWSMFWWFMVALAAVMLFFIVFSRRQVVYAEQYSYVMATTREPSFVTPVFELKGHPSNVEIQIRTDLDNNWAYFNLALINQDTGRGWDFGREVSYYYGMDGGESWSEGSRSDSVTLPSIPSGHYYLRIEPEMESIKVSPMSYYVSIRRDVPTYTFFLIAAVLLLIPPILAAMRIGAFETARWRESDYAPSSRGGK